MKMTLNVNIPVDFKHVCEIFDLEPESIVQKLIDKISFPVFFLDPYTDDRWATLFFLRILDVSNGDISEKWEEHKYYLDKLTEDEGDKGLRNEKASRKIMAEWHRSVLRKRSESLLNGLKEDSPD